MEARMQVRMRCTVGTQLKQISRSPAPAPIRYLEWDHRPARTARRVDSAPGAANPRGRAVLRARGDPACRPFRRRLGSRPARAGCAPCVTRLRTTEQRFEGDPDRAIILAAGGQAIRRDPAAEVTAGPAPEGHPWCGTSIGSFARAMSSVFLEESPPPWSCGLVDFRACGPPRSISEKGSDVSTAILMIRPHLFVLQVVGRKA